jgi:transposase-like protein
VAAARQPDAPKWRSYTDQERGEAVGLALAIGAKRAAAQLGIPRRTISSWIQTPSPGVQAAILRSRNDVAARLWEAVDAGTEAVLAGLRDPKARLGDKASALRIVVEAHALISGQATSRTESTVTTGPAMTWDQERDLRTFLDTLEAASDDELREWAASGGLAMVRDAQHEAAQLAAGEEGTDGG